MDSNCGLTMHNPLKPNITEKSTSYLLALYVSYSTSGKKLLKSQLESLSSVIMSLILLTKLFSCTGFRYYKKKFDTDYSF